MSGTLHRVRDKHGTFLKNSILTVETPGLSYVGMESDAQKPSGVNVFLGLLDKATGEYRCI